MNMMSSPGVCCTLKELLREAAQVRQTLHLKRKSQALHAGSRRSSIRGRGMEFFESRPYVAQDERKNIDWKVSARLNIIFTKVFVEEKDRPIILGVDLRSHMFFGTKNYFKSVLAAKISARLAQAAINGGDPVGALIFGDQALIETKSGMRRKDLALLLGKLAEATQDGPKNSAFPEASFWPALLSKLYYRAARGSAVFIISDFAAFDARAHAWLYRLRKRADIFVLSLFDPLEQELPSLGYVGMSYDNQRVYFDSSNKNIENLYKLNFIEQQKAREKIFMSLDIPYISFSTADNLEGRLIKLFSGRW
jgi:uncharacterized protein (DUF58 family)